MSLFEHLRELQVRLLRASVGILAGCGVAWIFYEPIVAFVRAPFDAVVVEAQAQGKEIVLAINGVTEAFTFQLQVVVVAGLVIALPVWLFQLWRFLVPGLERSERRWAVGFVAAATPLFLTGAYVAYRAMPQLLSVFLGFTPEKVANIININEYLGFILKILLFFGLGMVIPAIFVMANFAGILSAATLVRNWRWLLIGSLTFAAVATPTPDPVTMLMVALPFLCVVSLSVGITAINDLVRRRRSSRSVLSDDEPSPLPVDQADPAGDGAATLT